MTSICLLEKLESNSSKKIKLKINDNRTTMLSVKWEPDCTKVSLHRMFLEAPIEVLDSIGSYIRRENPAIDRTVKTFIEEKLRLLDYSRRLDQKKMSTKGTVYDLQAMYDGLNEKYFGGQLQLSVTWFGPRKPKNRTKISLGLYQETLKLIKIHKLLDNKRFPYYILEYVMYHEMVHFVCPPYVDENGVSRIHHKAFTEREQQYQLFHQADQWIKQHQHDFFNSTY